MASYSRQQVQIIAENMRHSPIALLIGAGCSCSSGIPLATGFIKEISEAFPATYSRLTADQQNNYGACMAVLTPQQRSKILTKKIEAAKINWAHIAIASMIKKGLISRVLTFNFDNILARACGLMGIYPPTYDFATSKSMDLKYIADKAIIHLHGQGHGMIKLNTSKETSDHAKQITPIIKDTVNSSSLLVIGYSGKSDAAFDELANSYTGENRIYWCDYDDSPGPEVLKLIESGQGYVEHLGKCDADQFLIDLALELECFPPQLIKAPFDHLLDELDSVTNYPLSETNTTDLLKGLRDRLKVAKDKEKSEKSNIEILTIKKNWQAIIDIGDEKSEEHKKLITHSYLMQSFDDIKDSNEGIDQQKVTDALTKINKVLSLDDKSYFGIVNYGVALYLKGKHENNIDLLKKSFAQYELAIEINPQNNPPYNLYGQALLAAFSITKDNEYLQKALQLLQKGEELNGDNIYNLACVYALLNKPELCREKLTHCKNKKTLPSKKHLLNDADLGRVRKLAWFKALISDLPDQLQNT